MQITNETKYENIASTLLFIDKASEQRLIDESPIAVFGKGGYYAMTIGQLGALIDGGSIADLIPTIGTKDMKVFEYYTARELPNFIEKFVKQLEMFSIKPTPKEQRASAGCYKVGAVEGLLLFARSYFGLHSFREAEEITLADLLIAKKDSYNEIVRTRAQMAQMKADAKIKHK